MNTEARVLARFAQDVENHKVTVKLDDGLYRHLVIKAPGTGVLWFELITTPGQLTIRGDMGTYVFAREQDMFDWFVDDKRAGNYINPHYWSEKLEAADKNTAPREYRADVAKAVIREQAEQMRESFEMIDALDFWARIEELTDWADYGEHELRRAIDRFEFEGESFSDTGEWDFDDYSYRFIWCLHAIVFAIKSYRAWSSIKPKPEQVERRAGERRGDDSIISDKLVLAEGRAARVASWAGGNR